MNFGDSGVTQISIAQYFFRVHPTKPGLFISSRKDVQDEKLHYFRS